MRSPRNVTLQPIDWPSRSLKPAIECLALVTIGFWPVIAVRSPTAPSSSDGCCVARPTPMLMTIFSIFGTCMTLPRPSCCFSVALTSSLYFFLRRTAVTASPVLQSVVPSSSDHLGLPAARLATRTFLPSRIL